MKLRGIADAAVALLMGTALYGCVGIQVEDEAARACRLLGSATEKSTHQDVMLGMAEAERTARNAGYDALADDIDALARAVTSGDTYTAGIAAIDIDQTCRDHGVNIDAEFGS